MMRQLGLRACLILVVSSFGSGLPVPVQAETSESAGMVCVAGTTGGSQAGQPLVFVVQEGHLSDFEARGFSVRTCDGVEARASEFRAKICELAATATPAIEQDFAVIYKLSPTELCSMLAG